MDICILIRQHYLECMEVGQCKKKPTETPSSRSRANITVHEKKGESIQARFVLDIDTAVIQNYHLPGSAYVM